MESELPTLYAHAKRPSWGKAILAWTQDDTRAYQFDDGHLRRFKKGFYHFLEPVDLPFDEAAELSQELERKLALVEARGLVRTEARQKGARVVTLKDQISIFRHLYPGGFTDPGYLEQHRGGEDSTTRKRHWNPAITRAQEALSKSTLTALLRDRAYAEIVESLKGILGSITLTSTKKDAGVWDRLPNGRTQAVAETLYRLLWDEGSYTERLDDFIKSLTVSGTRPSWPIATVPAALVDPENQIGVKPSVFRLQMRWMAPSAKLKTEPTGAAYRRMLKMAEQIRARTVDAGLAPKDLVDIHAFIWETMRPKSLQVLKDIRKP